MAHLRTNIMAKESGKLLATGDQRPTSGFEFNMRHELLLHQI
jgi:hypothetical protein